MKREHREWLEDFVLKAQAAQAAVSKLLQMEDGGMDKGNPYHPTGDARADGVRARTDELVAYVKRETEASGPEAKRAAALAATSYEQAWMWAERALNAKDAVKDAVKGDDGGAKGPDRTIPTELAQEISDARDADVA